MIKVVTKYVLTIDKSTDVPAEIETVSNNYMELYMKILVHPKRPSDIVKKHIKCIYDS